MHDYLARGARSAGVVRELATRQAADPRRRGGDVFAYAAHPGGSTILLADVSSKGHLGYRHAAAVRDAFLRAVARRSSPAHTLRELNRLPFAGAGDGSVVFASAVVVLIAARGGLVYAAAGHDGALVVRGRHHRHLVPTGPVLGVFGDVAFAEAAVEFDAGDRLALATDGVLEARDPSDGERCFGTLGIVRVLCRFGTAASAREVMDACDRHCQGEYRDDATVAVIAAADRSL